MTATRLLSVAIVAAASLLLPAVRAQLPPPEVWVVDRGALQLAIINPATLAVVDTVDVSDPDGDSIPDQPEDIAFSTSEAHPGTHAFVVQGRLLTVVDALSRSIVAVHDIAVDLGFPILTLHGCATAAPRELQTTTGGSVVRSYLHLAATLPTGDARWVVVDQELAIANVANPVVDSGLLASSATALDVQTLGKPQGDRFLRAWYSATRVGTAAPELLAVLVSKGEALSDPWGVVDTRSTTVPVGGTLPDVLRYGAPVGGELPVRTNSTAGPLENLDTGGTCPAGVDVQTVNVSGFGANSWTLIALDSASSSIEVLDPITCNSSSFPAGSDPVDVATLGLLDWREAFVANRGSGTVTWLNNLGASTLIPLGLPLSQPVAVDVAFRSRCTVRDLEVNRADNDNDGMFDDLLVTWRGVGCPAGTQYEVGCLCKTSEPDCPCAGCDCALPDQEGCFCSGIVPDVAFQGQQANTLQDPVGEFPVAKNPWKMLGVTEEMEFEHNDQAAASADWDYVVEPQDP